VTTSNQPVVDVGSMCSVAPIGLAAIRLTIRRLHKFQQMPISKDNAITDERSKWFSDDNADIKHGFILNETAVKIFKLKSPVTGLRFIFKGDTSEVIGVVKDFNYKKCT